MSCYTTQFAHQTVCVTCPTVPVHDGPQLPTCAVPYSPAHSLIVLGILAVLFLSIIVLIFLVHTIRKEWANDRRT